MSQYNFFCLCLDHDGKHLGDIFSLKISSGEYVSELQRAIKVQKALVTAHLEADQLRLWKLSTPVPAGGTRAERNETLKAIKFPDPDSVEAFKGNDSVQFLQPSETLSDYWEKPPERKHLHILVRLPPPGPPKHCPSWLVEFYDKLWGKPEREIFRTANLTKQDFQGLEDLLDKENPGRTSGAHVRVNVVVKKADYLRKLSEPLKMDPGDSLVPRLFDVTQAKDDDDVMDIDSKPKSGSHMDPLGEAKEIFPYTIRYVDLTVLGLKTHIRVPRLMLFRNEWDTMINIFNGINSQGLDGSAIITGQPGIGKTCLLYAIVILCMLRGQQFVFQDKMGMVFVVDHTGISTLERSKVFDHEVLGLVDADGDRCQPAENILDHGRCRILLTSSPRQYSDQKWLKQHANPLMVYTMEPWSRKELVVATLFMHDMDITLKQLQEVSDICGNIPRPCYNAARFDGALDATKNKMRAAVSEIKDFTRDIMNMADSNKNQMIHRLFLVRPASSSRLWESRLVQPVSAWAFDVTLERLPKEYMTEAFEMYCAIQGSPDAATLRGRIFESYLHRYITNSGAFTIKSLNKPSTTLSINITPDMDYHVFQTNSFSDCLASSVQSNGQWYLKPQSPIFPSFDSFLYLPGISGFSPLIALQVTTATVHGIKITGLELVQDAVKSKLKHLEPTKDNRMIILFVVPKAFENTFKKQKITGKENENVKDWRAKTAQYVVAFEEEDLFKVYTMPL